jgi:hypothetical protein
MSRAAQMSAAANDTVSRWPSLHARVARIYPIPGGGAQVSLAGVDRQFGSVLAAVAEVEAIGLTADVQPFQPTPLVLAEAPAP